MPPSMLCVVAPGTGEEHQQVKKRGHDVGSPAQSRARKTGNTREGQKPSPGRRPEPVNPGTDCADKQASGKPRRKLMAVCSVPAPVGVSRTFAGRRPITTEVLSAVIFILAL